MLQQATQHSLTLAERIVAGKLDELRQIETCHRRCLYCRREAECAARAEALKGDIAWAQGQRARLEASRGE